MPDATSNLMTILHVLVRSLFPTLDFDEVGEMYKVLLVKGIYIVRTGYNE